MDDKREIKALINKKTGGVIPIPEGDRPTITAFKNFKRPLYQMMICDKIKKRKENTVSS